MLMLNNTTQQLNKKQISTLHLVFHRSALVLSLENGAYPKNVPRVFCHNNSILYNHLCVWILRKVFPLKMCACLCCLIKIGVLFKFVYVCVPLRSNTEPNSLNHKSSGEFRREKSKKSVLIKTGVFLTFCVLLSSNAERTSLNHESSQEFRREKRKRGGGGRGGGCR